MAARLKYLLDSVILIDHLNGIEAATRFLGDYARSCAISVITRAEVLAGLDDEQAAVVADLLDLFPALPITVEIGDLAARLRRSERWKLPDALQAAVAQQHGLVLVTRNTRDFRDGEVIGVMVPYAV